MQFIQTTRAMRDDMFRCTTTGKVAEHLAPIVAALSGGVDVFILPACKEPIALPSGKLRKAFIGIIGDDLFSAEGPSAFHLRTLRRLFASAQAIYVMSGEINKAAYLAAANGALAGLRTLIIETRQTEEASWLDYAKRRAPRASKWVAQ